MGGTEEGERSDLSLGKEEDRRGDYARLVLSLWLVTEGAQRRASPGRDLMLTHYFYFLFFWGGDVLEASFAKGGQRPGHPVGWRCLCLTRWVFWAPS